MQSEVISDAMNMVISLLDEKSFVEIGANFKCGVICGYGTINLRPVCLFAQDSSIESGAINSKNCEKILNIIEMAEKNGVPIIGIYDSMGTAISENTRVLVEFRKVLAKLSSLSGVVPQVSIVLGNAVGMASFAVNFSDFTFMIDKKSKMFLNGPQNITSITGKEVTAENLGGAKVHSEKTGSCHVFTSTIEECIEKVHKLLSYLPDNNLADAEILDTDDINRVCELENTDINSVILEIIDSKMFFEIQENFAKNVTIGFARIGGRSVGVVGNRSSEFGVCDLDKVIRFVGICDSFNIPIITLINSSGTVVSIEEENSGLSSRVASLIYAYTNASVPKVNLVIGNMFGGAASAIGMCADMNIAWDTAKISVIPPKTAVNVLCSEEIASSEEPVSYRDEKIKEYIESEADPVVAESTSFIDVVIASWETRKMLISSLELYISKKGNKILRKHGNVLK